MRGRQLLGGIHRIHETGKPVNHRAVLGELIVRLAEKRQRALDLTKCLRCLHYIAKRDLLAEQPRRLNDERKDHRCLTDHQIETLKLERAKNDGPHIADHIGKARQQIAALDAFAAIERNAFAVFAQTHQRITKMGAELLIQKIQGDEWPPDLYRKNRCSDDVQVNQKHHCPRNIHSKNRQIGRQIPQNDAKRK